MHLGGKGCQSCIPVKDGDCLLDGTPAPLPNLLSGRLTFYIPTFPPSVHIKGLAFGFNCFFLFSFSSVNSSALFPSFRLSISILTKMSTIQHVPPLSAVTPGNTVSITAGDLDYPSRYTHDIYWGPISDYLRDMVIDIQFLCDINLFHICPLERVQLQSAHILQ